MTIDECIDALRGARDRLPEGGGAEVAVGVEIGEGGRIGSLSLRAGGKAVFEEKYGGEQPGPKAAEEIKEKIREVLRRYFEADPWTGEPSPDFDDSYTAQDAVDAVKGFAE